MTSSNKPKVIFDRRYKGRSIEHKLFTYSDLKAKYKLDVAYLCTDLEFEEYVKENFIKEYDIEFNFLGYSRSVNIGA